MISTKKPHNLLLRDAPDERDLLVVRQFQANNSISKMLMSRGMVNYTNSRSLERNSA